MAERGEKGLMVNPFPPAQSGGHRGVQLPNDGDWPIA